MTETMTFGEAIRRMRVGYALTQPEMAVRAGISKGMVSMVETGKRIPSAEMAHKIGRAFPLPRHTLLALLSLGGYASQESQEEAGLEIRAYLNTLDAPGSENKAPPRVIEGHTGIPIPRIPQRG